MASRLKILGVLAGLALASASCVSDGTEEDLSTVPLEGVVGPCTVTLALSPEGPVSAGSTVTATSTATCEGGATPEFRFWRRAPSGAWSSVQGYGSNNVFTWDTTATTTGTYVFQAWARAVGSTATYDGASPARTIEVENGTGQCYGTTLQGSPASPVSAGATVTFTGGSTCTPGFSAEYKFYVRNTSGVWSIAQDYSSDNTFDWNTTGQPQGSYVIQVWSRAAGNTAAYDAAAGTTYSVTTPSCNAITLYTPTPTSPRPVGTQVTLQALATCTGGSPEYQFWIRRPNLTWFNLGAYSASATANWDTTGLATGTYAIQAWTRRIGNTGAYDKASTLKTYVLN